jgi:hypothetical protein
LASITVGLADGSDTVTEAAGLVAYSAVTVGVFRAAPEGAATAVA